MVSVASNVRPLVKQRSHGAVASSWKASVMKIRLTLAAFAVLGLLSAGSACSCFGPQTFCGTLNPQPPQFPDPQWWVPSDIILAVKLGDYQYAADVKVIQVFQGDLLVDDQIRVWGDCGLLCRHYVNGNIGDTVLWAIQHCDLMGNGLCGTNYESPDDYHLSICGVYVLGYENGVVSGPLTEEGVEQQVTIPAFQALVDGCLSTGVPQLIAPNELKVRYTAEGPIIELADVEGAVLSVFDAQGRTLLRRAWNGSPFRIEGLAPGVFAVQVTRADQRWIHKVLVR